MKIDQVVDLSLKRTRDMLKMTNFILKVTNLFFV
jgi:hypothetical protein